MKARSKSIFVVVLAMALCLAMLAGCAPAATTTAGTTKGTTTAATTATTAAPTTTANPNLTPWGYDKTDVYTIKVMGGVDSSGKFDYWKKFSETDVGKVILEKFGLDFEPIVYTETAQERANILLATGEYYDLQQMPGAAITQAYVEAGVVVSMEPFFEKMTNFQKVFSFQIPIWRKHMPNNEIAYWEFSVPYGLEDNVAYNPLSVRADALDLYCAKYGWDKPPIYLDEYVELLQMAKDAGLTDLDGKPCIGVTAPFAEGWGLEGIAISLFENCSDFASLGRTICFQRSSKSLMALPDTTIIKNMHKFWNDLYNKGLLDEECFTDKGGETADKCKKAQPIMVWYANWEAYPANPFIVEAGQPEKQYVLVQPATPTEDRGKQNKWNVLTTADTRGAVVTTKSKEPGRIFELVEYICSEEGAILFGSGIEGKHWEKVNGVRTEIQADLDKSRTDLTYAAMRGVDVQRNFSLPSFQLYMSDGVSNVLSWDLAFRYRQRDMKDITNIYAEKFGRKLMQDWIMKNTKQVRLTNSPPAIAFETGSDLAATNQEMKDRHVRWMYDMWTCTPDKFESVYAAMLEDFHKLDVEGVLAAYTKMIDASFPDWKEQLPGD